MESQQAPHESIQQQPFQPQQFETQPMNPQQTETETHFAPPIDLSLQNQPQQPNDNDDSIILQEVPEFIHESVDNPQNTENIENVVPDPIPIQHEPEPISEAQNIQEPMESFTVMDESIPLIQPPQQQMESVIQQREEPQIQPMEAPQMEEEQKQQLHPPSQPIVARQSPSLPPDIPQDPPSPPNVPQDPPSHDDVHEQDSIMVDHVQEQQQQIQEHQYEQYQPQQERQEQQQHQHQHQHQHQQQHQQQEEVVQTDSRMMFEDSAMNEEEHTVNTTEERLKEELPEPMDTDDIDQDNTHQLTMQPFSTNTNINTNNNNDIEAKKEVLIPELVLCRQLLEDFTARIETEPFNAPVDWKGLNLPDYPLIITKPMDLGTVAKKLEYKKYLTADEFAGDVRLVFKNAKTYNMVGSGIYLVAESLLKQFERRYARITKNVSHRKRKTMDKIKNGEESTYKERVTFTTMIQRLLPAELGGVVEIIDKKCPMALNGSYGEDGLEDEMEIEVYHIDGPTLRDLIIYIEKTITKRVKKKKKEEYY